MVLAESSHRTRQHDSLVFTLTETVKHSSSPQYVQDMYADIVASKLSGYPEPETLLERIKVAHTHAFRLAQLTSDFALDPLAWAQAHAEMKAFVAASRLTFNDLAQSDPQAFGKLILLVVENNSRLPEQTVLKAHQAKLESLQLSKAQHASIAEKGMAFFEQQRTYRAQLESLNVPFAEVFRSSGTSASGLGATDPHHLAQFSSLLDQAVGIKNAEMVALSSTLNQIFGSNLLGDEQFTRYISWTASEPILPAIYHLMMMLTNSWLLPSVQRSPSPRMARGAPGQPWGRQSADVSTQLRREHPMSA
ncbi:hypothetical protein WJX73_001111 [Symbiochloris irregularis]|uniref:Uncharacterized protein n=1 Tax=Symbiochloris irregularis TaxID=706552 RepID=A0AAW1NYY7_9CHLO